MAEKLLTIKEAAKRLNYSERQIRQMCVDGRLAGAVKIGGRGKWLIPESSLKTSLAGGQQPDNVIVNTYGELLQIEHISRLQALAKRAVNAAYDQGIPSGPSDLEEAEIKYWRIFGELTGDANWRALAAHLGDEAKAIENMASTLEPDLVPPWKMGEAIEPYMKIVRDAYNLLTSGGLKLIAENGDEKAWERFGLSSKCRWCQK
jgi:excisionase family DNA binding protein